MEDAILYLLQRAYSHLDKERGAVRIYFFDFSSAFNTIQPLLLRDKLTERRVDLKRKCYICLSILEIANKFYINCL